MVTPSLWDQVKALAIRSVAERLGLQVSTSGKARCIYPEQHTHGDRTPSLSLHRKSNTFRCFLCPDVRGSNIDLVMAVKGLSAAEAVRWLADEFGVARGNRHHDANPGSADSGDSGNSGNPKARRPITVEDLARDKALPVDFLKGLGLENRPDGVLIAYRMQDGSLAPRQRLRTALKAKDGSYWLPGEGEPVPYGLDGLDEARRAGFLVLEEGESDRWTLSYHNFPVLGPPGAKMAGTIRADHLAGIPRVYVLREPGRSGDEFTAGVARRLPEIGWTGEALEVRLPDSKDANDLHRRNPEGFKWSFQDALEQAKPLMGAAEWEPPVPFHEFNLPAFPTAALPDWLRKFVEAEAVEKQTPLDLPAMLALSVCAAASAKKVIVHVKRGHTEPINVFTVVALPPGNRKSAVFVDMTAPLEEYEEVEARRMGPEIAEAQTRYKILEARIQKVQANAAKARPEQRAALTQEATELARGLAGMNVPSQPRFLADDTSPERLATLLRDQGGRMAVMSPEGDVFDLMAGRYSSNGAPNFGVYLKGHAGDTLRVDRVGRPAEYVKAPALTLGLAPQPEVLRGLMEKPGFRGRGLLGRFLYALPKSLLGHRETNPRPVVPAMRTAYDENVRAILALPFGTDEEGNPTAHLLRLSPSAQERMQQFEAWVEPQLAEFGELGSMTDWGGKLVGAVARIAGVLHMAEYAGKRAAWDVPIQLETVERAVHIGKYLIPHARAAYAEMGADPVIEAARYVLTWMIGKSLRTFTKRDVYQGTKGRFKRVESLTPVLDLLVDHGFIRERVEGARTGPGRRPSPTYEVNPWVYSPNSRYAHNSCPADRRLPDSGDCGNCGNTGKGEANRAEANPRPTDEEDEASATDEADDWGVFEA